MSQRWGYGEDGAYIRKDGTLWISGNVQRRASNSNYTYGEFGTFQIGKETNWISASRGWGMLVALKSDGTLWQWHWNLQTLLVVGDVPAAQPTRLGIHNDWVAIAGVEGGVMSLAADGSLWFWPERQNYAYRLPLLKLPKQPQFLGNVFGKTN